MKWGQVEFRRVDPDDPAIDAMLTALRNTHCMLDDNRGVLLACFEARDPGEFDEAAREDRHPNEISLLALMRNPSIRESLNDLQIGPSVEMPGLHVLPLRVAKEQLANRLRSGGALGGMNWSIEEARQLSEGLLAGVLDYRQWRVTAAITNMAWTTWFYGVTTAWDLTVLLCCFPSRRFIVLAVTDSD